MAELLKAATAEKSSRDVTSLDLTPGVATNGVLSYSEALDGSKPPQQIPDLSGMKAVGQSAWPEVPLQESQHWIRMNNCHQD